MRQFRSGFYHVGGIVALFYIGLLQLLPQDDRVNLPLLIPAILMLNVLVTTFYFVAAMVLLEKSEGSLSATAVTPLRTREYLTSKVATLTFLAIAENVLVLAAFYGFGFAPLTLLLGTVLLCALLTLAGFVAVSPCESINAFIIPSSILLVAIVLPLLDHFGAVTAPFNLFFYLHPVQPSLVLLRAAFNGAAGIELVYGLAAGALWLRVAYLVAERAYRNLAVRAA